RLTSSVLKGLTRNEQTSQHHSALALACSTTAELTIRGGGQPYSNMARYADLKNGPAARGFPMGQARGLKAHADAHAASWSGSNDPAAYRSYAVGPSPPPGESTMGPGTKPIEKPYVAAPRCALRCPRTCRLEFDDPR